MTQTLTPSIVSCLMSDQPFALAVIMTHQGSTPRTSGSAMLVRKDRTIEGTIGGGLVEAKVIRACAGMLDGSQSKIMGFNLTQELKQGMDMVCGGSLTVWIRTFAPPFQGDLTRVYQALSDLETSGKTGWMVTRISEDAWDIPTLLTPDGSQQGGKLPNALTNDILRQNLTGPGPVCIEVDADTYVIEPVMPKETLFIFGAGHVGYQLGRMAHLADFSTVVVDDRKEFANEQRFPHAGQVKVVDAFSSAFENLCIDRHCYVVILTRGHLHDQIVLEQALRTKACYIGMIGSRKKRDTIYANLMIKGVSQEQLETVHSPIGTKIKAQTPAEIAVSILSELILVRAGQREDTKQIT